MSTRVVDPAGVRKLFPLLLPLKSDFTELFGFINIVGKDVCTRISIICDVVYLKTYFDESWVQREMCPSETVEKLEPGQSLLSMLTIIKGKLETEFKSLQKTSTYKSAKFVPLLLDYLDKLGYDKIESMGDSLESIVFKSIDEAERVHLLEVKFSLNRSASPQEYFTDFPSPFQPSKKALGNLDILYMDFEEQVKEYQNFWNILDEIDGNTWVLEPEHPQRRDCKRRLALSKKSSIQFSILPSNPTAVPECQFFGPDSEIGPLWTSFSTSIDHWNENISVLTNLRELLCIEFPSKSTTLQEDIEEVCVICYSFRLNDTLPDKSCENVQCRQAFHMECLFEWLHGHPNTRQSFKTFFGECPNCNKPITCKMP